MSTYDVRANACLALLAPLLPAWLEVLKAAYRAAAENQAKHAPKSAADFQPTYYRPYWRLASLVKLTVEKSSYAKDEQRQLVIAGNVAPDYERAERQAQVELNDARDTFAARLVDKLATCFGREPDIKLSGDVRLAGGCIEGVIIAKSGENEVRFDAAGKTNYRYGENSANKDITQYAQYPFRVVFAVIKGHGELHNTSAEVVGALITGRDVLGAEKAAAKAAKLGLRTELDRLTRLKGAYNDQASTLGAIETYAANAEYVGRLRDEADKRAVKYNLDACATKKEATAKAREVLAQIKALKAANQPAKV